MKKILQTALVSAIMATSGFAGGKTSSFDDNAVLMDGADIASGHTATMASELYNFGEIKATSGSATITTSETSGTIYNGYGMTPDTTNSADDDFKAKVSALLGNCVICTVNSGANGSSDTGPCYDSGTSSTGAYQVNDVWKVGSRGTIDSSVTLDSKITKTNVSMFQSMVYQKNYTEDDVFGDHRVFNLVVPKDASDADKTIVITAENEEEASDSAVATIFAAGAFVSVPANENEITPTLETNIGMSMTIFRGFTGEMILKGGSHMHNDTTSDLVMQGKFSSDFADDGTTADISFNTNGTKITFNEEVDVSKTGATFTNTNNEKSGTYVFRKKLTL